MLRVRQPNGTEAIVCSERCYLAQSDNIDAARQWAQQPLEPNPLGEEYSEAGSVSLTEKDQAVRCMTRILRGACGVSLDML